MLVDFDDREVLTSFNSCLRSQLTDGGPAVDDIDAVMALIG